jgi:hypothetical protein
MSAKGQTLADFYRRGEDGVVTHFVRSTLKYLAGNYGVHVRCMPRLLNKGPEYEVVQRCDL